MLHELHYSIFAASRSGAERISRYNLKDSPRHATQSRPGFGHAQTMTSQRSVIGYLRVSTTEQGLSGLGLDAQRSAIETECARQGWDLVATIADVGVSGSKPPAKRPGLSDALNRIGRGEAELLVALRLDRLGRDAVDVLHLTKTTEIALVDFPADLTTPAGRMVLTVLAGAAELERGLISERTRAAIAEAKRRGVHCGRARTMPEAIRTRILDAHSAGESLNSIARGFNAEGVPTAHGGSKWYATTIRQVVISRYGDITP